MKPLASRGSNALLARAREGEDGSVRRAKCAPTSAGAGLAGRAGQTPSNLFTPALNASAWVVAAVAVAVDVDGKESELIMALPPPLHWPRHPPLSRKKRLLLCTNTPGAADPLHLSKAE